MAPEPDMTVSLDLSCDMPPSYGEVDGERRPLISSTTKKDPGGKCCSARYFVSYMAFLGFATSFMCRVNMSVAITAMVNNTYSTDYAQNSTGDAEVLVCPAPDDSAPQGNHTDQTGDFAWDTHTQELILSAFFYGFVLLQIPAGLLADRYPRACTWIYGVGICVSSICTLLTPLAANHGVVAVFVARFVSGLAESGSYPSMYCLMSRWSPPADRSTLLAIVMSGLPLGQMMAQPISGFLASSRYGWPSSFYLFGTLGLIWFVFWSTLVYDSPDSHPSISLREREYITLELLQVPKRKTTKPYPWLRLLTSPAVLAVTVADFASHWILHAMTTNLPIFLTEALRLSVSKAGLYSALPQAMFFVIILSGGFMADCMISRTGLSRTNIRKIMTTIGLVPSAIFMVISGYTGCNSIITIISLSLGLGFTGAVYSGASLTQMEFAPSYAGMVTAVANTAANMPGFIAPLVVGVFTENQADLLGWRNVFWVSFGVAVFAEFFFLICGTAELQPWAMEDEQKVKKAIKYEELP